MENSLGIGIQQIDVRIQNNLPGTQTKDATPLDTGLKWTPLTLLLIADIVGLKTRNNFKQHALRFIIAEAILNVTLLPVKKAVNRERPNGNPKSFPSGHSA